MTWVSDMPFQRKLRFAILLTSTVAMMLACAVFLAVEFRGYRQNLARTVETLARITADNSTAAIAFADPGRARATLEALRAEPQVMAAALCTRDGRVVASYSSRPEVALPPIPPALKGVTIGSGRVLGVQPVIQGSQWLGTLYVWASMDQLYERIGLYGLVVLAVLAATFAFAWLSSSILRRTIARPILELVNTTGAITAAQDFSLRARQYGSDELGRLTEAFNAMLARTEAAVAALRENEEQLRLVTDNAPVLLTQCDRLYRFTFVNRPNAARFGLEPHQIVGRHMAEVMGADAFHAARPHIDAALAGRRIEFELEVADDAGGSRWMHTVYVPDRRADGSVAGFVGVVSDVTRRKLVERQVARARDEALAASRAKDEFLAALSHELRTPLNPVLLIASDSAQDLTLPPGARGDFETIRKHIELEARLIDDLLDLTAITRGKLSLVRQPTDLHAALRDALATVSPDVDEKRIRLVLHTRAARPAVMGDAVRLQQVFWNVLKNAVKFTPCGGRIAVETAAAGDRVSVRVSDTGIGLTPSERERIFEAFSQGDHAAEGGSHRFGGLGLGLAISRMVIELHNGTIHAESEGRGRGATFTIELPLVAAAEADAGIVAAGEGAAPRASPFDDGNNHTRILLVEDHVATRQALERLLVRRNFTVCTAGSLADARALLGANEFDLVISDVGLPDGSGYDLMQEVAARFQMKGIALTGYGMEQDLARSQEAGFSAHLTKPVRVEALDAALTSVLAD